MVAITNDHKRWGLPRQNCLPGGQKSKVKVPQGHAHSLLRLLAALRVLWLRICLPKAFSPSLRSFLS